MARSVVAKTRKSARGRTAAARCATPGCGGAARPGHASTATHRAAVLKLTVQRGGPADEKRVYHMPSREREDAYYAELAQRDRAEAIAWLIEAGPLPDEPIESYDGSVALITLKEAARRLELSDITLRSAIRRGRMTARKMGRDWLVEESEVRYYELTSLGRVGYPKGRPRKSA